jgi:hypothetical protein
LVVGIFYSEVLLGASLSMAFLMICALLAHLKVKNPWPKYIPSFILLVLSVFIAAFNSGLFR